MQRQDLPVQLILDDKTNTTYNGVISVVVGGVPPVVSPNGANATTPDYDHHGAGLFIVLVIVVYALSIVLLIASFIKKKQSINNAQEEQNTVHQYLTAVPQLKESTSRDEFKKLKKSVIKKIDRMESRAGAFISIDDGMEEIRDRRIKAGCGDKDFINNCTSNVIFGAGVSLYQPLLAINTDSASDSSVETNTRNDEGIVITAGRYDDDGTPLPTVKQVRLKLEPEILEIAKPEVYLVCHPITLPIIQPTKALLSIPTSPGSVSSLSWPISPDSESVLLLHPLPSPNITPAGHDAHTSLIELRDVMGTREAPTQHMQAASGDIQAASPHASPLAARIKVEYEDPWTPRNNFKSISYV